MLHNPVVIYLSRLVDDVASHPTTEYASGKGDDDDRISSNETLRKGILSPQESVCSSDTKALPKKPRIHRVGQRKSKRWRGSASTFDRLNFVFPVPREMRQSQRLPPQKSRVDRKLGGTDPFGAFDLPRHSTTDLALHHWATVFQHTRMPVSPRRAWMKINLSDKTLLSVTTYCSIYHFYFLRGMRPPPSTLGQKVNAIQNINRTLRKPNSIPNDYTMVAVAMMTLLECFGGDLTACCIHRKGLQLMIQVRGGLENLGFDGAAQRTISWADSCSAIILRIKPTLNPALIPNASESAIPGFTLGDLEARLEPLTTAPALTRSILYIWLRLRYLAEFLAAIPNKNTSKIDDSFFSDKIDLIERQVLSVFHSDNLAEGNSVAFLTAFLNAALIFIYEELRECPKWNYVSVCLSLRIYSGLEMMDLSSLAMNCPDLLLWILLLGRSGISPLGGPHKPWYLSLIAGMELTFGVKVPAALSGLKYFQLPELLREKGSMVVATG